ncbi:MAG: flippase-like domain-containing protein [Anaerolineaceae bacterium]|nr:flippase-like domain-containing protein [Anaerolineaceae bacterium]
MQELRDLFKDNSPRARRRRQLASLGAFVLICMLVAFTVPWSETWAVLRTVDRAAVALALLFSLPAQFLRALSFRVIAAQQKMEISVWQIWVIDLIVGFYEIFLPSTFFGSGLRWYRYTRASKKPSQSFAALTYYKVFNIFLVLLLSFGFLLFNESNALNTNLLQVGLLMLGVIFALILIPSISKWLLNRFPQPKTFRGKPHKLIDAFARKILTAFVEFRQLSFRAQLTLIILGVLTQMVQVGAYFYFARGVGIELTFSQLGALRAVLLLAVNLPINFSPGIGVREVSLVALLTAMNIELEYAVAMSVVVFARTILFGLMGGMLEGARILRKHQSGASPKA